MSQSTSSVHSPQSTFDSKQPVKIQSTVFSRQPTASYQFIHSAVLLWTVVCGLSSVVCRLSIVVSPLSSLSTKINKPFFFELFRTPNVFNDLMRFFFRKDIPLFKGFLHKNALGNCGFTLHHIFSQG